MSYKKEIILNFPLRKSDDSKNHNSNNRKMSDEGVKEKLNRFYRLTEKLREDEWHQEYFLIYNSYVLENVRSKSD